MKLFIYSHLSTTLFTNAKIYRIIYEARILLSNCDDLLQLPTTSHLDACQFVADDHNAQLCFRLVQWLEGLASKALDLENKVSGCIFC